jgi:Ser/Thr protein kinase RdoA (MazF antagonist)
VETATASVSSTCRPRPEVQVVRYRPHLRCVLRYLLGSREGQGSEDVIGKAYREGSKAARAWHAQNALYAQTVEGVIIPRPIRLISEWNLVLMAFVPGTPMKQVLDAGTTVHRLAEEATRRIAVALAALHRVNYQGEETRTLDNQLHLFRDRAADLHVVAPLLAKEVDALLDRIGTLAERSNVDALSCIHGECKASQFLMDHDQVVMVDFDRVCLGDPALDVGNFMASLHKEAVQGQEYARDLASQFLTEYQECFPRNGLATRARLFLIASLVRMAVRSFRKKPYVYGRAAGDSLPALLLREAGACLAAL